MQTIVALHSPTLPKQIFSHTLQYDAACCHLIHCQAGDPKPFASLECKVICINMLQKHAHTSVWRLLSKYSPKLPVHCFSMHPGCIATACALLHLYRRTNFQICFSNKQQAQCTIKDHKGTTPQGLILSLLPFCVSAPTLSLLDK